MGQTEGDTYGYLQGSHETPTQSHNIHKTNMRHIPQPPEHRDWRLTIISPNMASG